MKRRIALFLALISSFSAYCFTVPANDECSGAILLTVNNSSDCTNTYTGTQEGATQSLPPCINTGYEAKDVWFSFVATATTHRIAVNSINYRDKIFEVYSGSCGSLSSIACVNSGASGEQDVTVLNGLVIGNAYFIRVYDKFANTPQSEFTICINTATSTIVNDECTGAINIPVNSTPVLQQHYSTYGATQSMPGCYGTAEDDIWFKFTATGNRHKIWVSVTDDKFNPVVEVFTGSCGSLVSRGCYYTVEIDPASLDVDLTGLTPGTTYYYRVYGKTANNVRTDILTSVVTMPAVPANDECTGAIALTVNGNGNCTNQYTGTQDAATQSLPPCVYTGYEAKDVWFKFVATAASHVITVNAIQYRDKLFEVFSGSCGNLTSIACVNSGGLGEQDAVVLNNLSAGATYYIRVYDKYANTQQSEFTICINTASSIINNNECTGAIDIPIYSTPNLQQHYSTYGATQSMPGCYGTAEDDVWFKFTATASRHKIWVTVTDDHYNPVIEVFDGNCGSLSSRKCFYTTEANPSSLDLDLTGLTPGTTYYYRVYGKAADNVRTDISTSVVTMPATPANDECSGAVSLTVNSDTTCTVINNATQESATQSLPSCIAIDWEAKDVWYKFVATAASHRIAVNSINYRDKIFQVYSGACGSLVSLACVNTGLSGQPDTALLNNLVPGTTYYIRVYDKYANTQQSEFTICIRPAPTPPASPVTAVNDLELDRATTIYPNPYHSGAIHIKIDNVVLTGAEATLYDQYGRQVAQRRITQHNTEWTPTGLSTGVYLMEIKVDKKTITRKLLAFTF